MKKMTVAPLAAMLLVGCTGLATTSMLDNRTMTLVPKVTDGSYTTQANVHLWVKADIDHLNLTLKIGGTTKATKTIASGSINNPVTFSNLRDNTTYTVLAEAYTTTAKISDDASSSTTITVGTSDTPGVGVIPVGLNNVMFNASPSTTIGVTDGHYVYPGNETM